MAGAGTAWMPTLWGNYTVTVSRDTSESATQRCQKQKTYLTSCCVHLDLLASLDADTFLLALRRFIAWRGTLLSDQGTNFRRAERELNKACGPGATGKAGREPGQVSVSTHQQYLFLAVLGSIKYNLSPESTPGGYRHTVTLQRHPSHPSKRSRGHPQRCRT